MFLAAGVVAGVEEQLLLERLLDQSKPPLPAAEGADDTEGSSRASELHTIAARRTRRVTRAEGFH
jgi:hypothetical protein